MAPLNVRERGIVVAEAVRHYSRATRVGPISVAVSPGECLGLIGANGAGKTTLLKMITGLQPTDSGRITVCGEPVACGVMSPQLSALIEEPRFYPGLTGADNLRVVCGGLRQRVARIGNVLDRVGLAESAGRPVRAYSQGMRQRLGIARVLLCDTPIVILDEPTNGLDPLGIRWLRSLVRDLVAEQRAVILASHLIHEVQAAADTYVMLVEGHVAAHGLVRDIAGHASLEDLYFAVQEDARERVR